MFYRFALAATGAFLIAASLSAQSVLDRPVGPDLNGTPLMVTGQEAFWTLGLRLGALARATSVPIGVEVGPPRRKPSVKPRDIVLTGRTLGDALDALMSLNPGYEWREMDGVIVLRPTAAWNDLEHWLVQPAPPMRMRDGDTFDAATRVARMFGVAGPGDGGRDTKRFSVSFESGTVLDLLNAIVRAHGELAWSISAATLSERDDLRIGWFSGRGSAAIFGLPRAIRVMRDVHDPAELGNATALDESPESLLARVIPPTPESAFPLSPGPGSVIRLGRLMEIPIGVEKAPHSWAPSDVTLTGRTVREVLDHLTMVDPPYEWRVVDGAIVFRPAEAWYDPRHRLFRRVPAVHLTDEPVDKAIDVLVSVLGVPGFEPVYLGDSRRVSMDFPGGTALELLSAITRTHGGMMWDFHRSAVEDRRRCPYTLTVWVLRGTGSTLCLR